MNGSSEMQNRLSALQRGAAIAGAAGLGLTLLGALLDREAFYQAWLLAFVFWLSVTLGCLGLAMLIHVIIGNWRLVSRRFFETGAMCFPVLVLALIPLYFGLSHLFEWADPEVMAHDPLLQKKEPWLNERFFWIRNAAYFAVWMIFGYALARLSRKEDRQNTPELQGDMRALSAGGLVLFVLTASFALMDWVMTLEPHWFSTIFGALLMMGGVLSAFALVTALACWLSRSEPLASAMKPNISSDHGSLMFAFLMIWAYLAFSQYLLIWSGNLIEETPWYLRRLQGGWQWAAVAVALFHFIVPFFLLLPRDIKGDPRRLMRVALFLFAMRLLDTFWTVAPALHRETISVHWMDLTAVVGLGGAWIAVFAAQLKRWPIPAANDPCWATLPEVEEELAHG